ncbi:MAG: hypothetical protein KDK69_04325, partial [Chlamydiia bacterium]|nr:hypothetical protein [Chlamydiia bacterium]
NGSPGMRLAKSVLFNGSSLALAYTIAAFCIRTISRSYLNPPSLPKLVVWLTLPLALYNDLYIVTGYLVHLATFPLLRDILELDLDVERAKLADIPGSVVKRFPIQANGSLIDAVIIGNQNQLANGRWIIFSQGNGEFYEQGREDYIALAKALQANILFYNYAAVGASSGFLPDHEAELASHAAMHAFARAELGAKEIIDFGHSIGGGVQGQNLHDLELSPEVKYVFVKHMTFGRLSRVADEIAYKTGFLIHFLNWEYDSTTSSKKLEHPEIIIQQGKNPSAEYMQAATDLKETDDVIPGVVSLAKEVFEDKECLKDKKRLLLVPESHNALMSQVFVRELATIINRELKA